MMLMIILINIFFSVFKNSERVVEDNQAIFFLMGEGLGDLPYDFNSLNILKLIHDYPTRHVNDLNLMCYEKSLLYYADHARQTSVAFLNLEFIRVQNH